MAHEGLTKEPREGSTSQKGGFGIGAWKPSFGFKVGLAGLGFFTAILIVATLAAAQGDAGTPTASPTATLAPEKDDGNKPNRPRDNFALEAPSRHSTVPDEVGGLRDTATGISPSTSGPSSATADPGEDVTTEEAATATPTVGDSASATPSASTPAPGRPLTPAASWLAAEIEATYGVSIQSYGQDWGQDEEDQVRNLGAVSSALSSLPAGLMDEVRVTGGGPLTFLSNHYGRTLDGWQPYGATAANFYTNEDQGQAGRHATNQVVLQPGSTRHTVTHEIIHAYQLRYSAPGAFTSALLGGEMKSFMAATGWKQLVGDEEVIATTGGSWAGVNQLFSYEGPTLLYINQWGSISELYAPNPMEAFAEAAALYYSRDAHWPLPSWDNYWDWFEASLG